MNYAYWKQGLLYCFSMLKKQMMSCQHVTFGIDQAELISSLAKLTNIRISHGHTTFH